MSAGGKGFQINNELWRKRKVRVNLPSCKHCGKTLKRLDRLFCSAKCYTLSGRRKTMGIKNGGQAYMRYWVMFAKVFLRKYGHLTQVQQIRLLVQMGQRRAYRSKYSKKAAIEGETRGSDHANASRVLEGSFPAPSCRGAGRDRVGLQ